MDDRYRAAWGLSGPRQDADGLVRASPGCYRVSRLARRQRPRLWMRVVRSRFKDDRKHPIRVAPHTARLAEIEISKSQASDQPKAANRRDRNLRHDRSAADWLPPSVGRGVDRPRFSLTTRRPLGCASRLHHAIPRTTTARVAQDHAAASDTARTHRPARKPSAAQPRSLSGPGRSRPPRSPT